MLEVESKAQAALEEQVWALALESQGEGPQEEPVGVLVQAQVAATQASCVEKEQSLTPQVLAALSHWH